MIPDEADWVADIAARNNFIVEKFSKGFEDAGDDLELDALKGGCDNIRKQHNIIQYFKILKLVCSLNTSS